MMRLAAGNALTNGVSPVSLNRMHGTPKGLFGGDAGGGIGGEVGDARVGPQGTGLHASERVADHQRFFGIMRDENRGQLPLAAKVGE